MAIKKVLIANRGEIAVRLARSCREEGIQSVAVYSDADKNALHARVTDEAVHIGPSAASESYLSFSRILDAAKKTGADAIHPGYGFLSENADFADACREAGLIFIGPGSDAVRRMGSKIEAKKLLAGRKDIPLIPGTVDAIGDAAAVAAEAQRVGLPVLLKASAGGGGKGMRVVRHLDELEGAVELAQKEALSSFGDSSLLLEKYFENVKHIEVQIVGDEHGNVMHLFERECSVQRRHQKVVEEAPSSCVSPALRERMTAAAVAIGKVIGYVSLGTVEFILDVPTQEFYFLEVNTRLQVEHPVTEAVTGLDLVSIQLAIANGKSLFDLGIDQAEISGHAVEARLYAEDPTRNFFPCTGTIHRWQPAQVPGLRYDTGIEDGSAISVFYDPLVSKVIAFGATRGQAVTRLALALRQTVVLGVTTNRMHLVEVLQHRSFLDGSFTTSFIEKEMGEEHRSRKEQERLAEHKATMAIVAMLFDWSFNEQRRSLLRNLPSGWRNNPYRYQSRTFLFPGEEEVKVEYKNCTKRHAAGASHVFEVVIDGSSRDVELLRHQGTELSCAISGVTRQFSVWATAEGTLHLHSDVFGNVSLHRVSRYRVNDADRDSDEGELVAQMPARILEVAVTDGQRVAKGDTIVVIESMKMQTRMAAAKDGIARVFVAVDQLVEAGTTMATVETEEAA